MVQITSRLFALSHLTARRRRSRLRPPARLSQRTYTVFFFFRAGEMVWNVCTASDCLLANSSAECVRRFQELLTLSQGALDVGVEALLEGLCQHTE